MRHLYEKENERHIHTSHYIRQTDGVSTRRIIMLKGVNIEKKKTLGETGPRGSSK